MAVVDILLLRSGPIAKTERDLGTAAANVIDFISIAFVRFAVLVATPDNAEWCPRVPFFSLPGRACLRPAIRISLRANKAYPLVGRFLMKL
jgi:hypothetical protein